MQFLLRLRAELRPRRAQHLARKKDVIHLARTNCRAARASSSADAPQLLSSAHACRAQVNVVPLDATYSPFNLSPVSIVVDGGVAPAFDPELRRLAARGLARATLLVSKR